MKSSIFDVLKIYLMLHLYRRLGFEGRAAASARRRPQMSLRLSLLIQSLHCRNGGHTAARVPLVDMSSHSERNSFPKVLPTKMFHCFTIYVICR